MTAENTFTDYKITAFSEIAEQSVTGGKQAGVWFLPTVVLICCMPATSGICRLQPHLLISSSWG